MKLWFMFLTVLFLGLGVFAADSALIGVEHITRIPVPHDFVAALRPVIFEQPVQVRLWKEKTDSAILNIAWCGMVAGQYDLREWVSGIDSTPLPIEVCGTLTDSDDGVVLPVHTPWNPSFPIPGYILLMSLVVMGWILALPAVWFIRRRLYPRPPPSIVTDVKPTTLLAEIEELLTHLENQRTLGVESQCRLYLLLLNQWNHCRHWHCTSVPDICVEILKTPALSPVYDGLERWMFHPDAPFPDIEQIRLSCRDCESEEEGES